MNKTRIPYICTTLSRQCPFGNTDFISLLRLTSILIRGVIPIFHLSSWYITPFSGKNNCLVSIIHNINTPQALEVWAINEKTQPENVGVVNESEGTVTLEEGTFWSKFSPQSLIKVRGSRNFRTKDKNFS